MNLSTWTNSPLWIAWGWTMLHFLWIGTAFWILAWAGRVFMRSCRPETRYVYTLACFSFLAVLPPVLCVAIPQPTVSTSISSREAAVGRQAAPVELSPKLLNSAIADVSAVPSNSDDVSPLEAVIDRTSSTEVSAQSHAEPLHLATMQLVTWLPGVWLVCVPVMLLFVTTGVLGAERFRRQCRVLEHGPIAERLQQLTHSLSLACTVQVGVCARVTTPILVGIVRPLILLPPAALTGWTPEQVEMVLWHELAHVRRWDNLINLMQRVVEALWFFHPAVWVLSGWVRQEREFCCDAFVVARTGEPQAYAQVLTSLSWQASLRRGLSPMIESQGTAMAKRHLVERVRHILGNQEETMQASRRFAGLVLAVLIATVFGASWWSAEGRHVAAQQLEGRSRIADEPREPEPPPKAVDANHSHREPADKTRAKPAPPSSTTRGDGGTDEDQVAVTAGSTITVTNCRIQFSEHVSLASHATGVIAAVPKEGDTVKKGETVVTLVGAKHIDEYALRKARLQLDIRQKELHKALEANIRSGGRAVIPEIEVERLRTAVKLAELEVERAEQTDASSIALAQQALRNAKEELLFAQRLKEKGFITDAEVQQKEFAVKQAEFNLKRAESAELSRVASLTIKAPFSGIITKVMKSPGEGVQAAEAVVELVTPDHLRVEGNVHYTMADAIRPGLPVTVKVLMPRKNALLEFLSAEHRQALADIRKEIEKLESLRQYLLKHLKKDSERFQKTEQKIEDLRKQESQIEDRATAEHFLFEQEFPGRVTYVAPSVNPVTSQVSVTAEINNTDRKLRPGVPATMTIQLSEK